MKELFKRLLESKSSAVAEECAKIAEHAIKEFDAHMDSKDAALLIARRIRQHYGINYIRDTR